MNKIKSTEFQQNILSWYDTHQRVLPWRESRDPYHIWVSEIMLQQTRVETVIPYYNRFVTELPSIFELANADVELLYKLWEGLGYYSRVRNLQKAAIQVVQTYGGVLPRNRKELESLSGVGPYTSGAISSIAYEQKNPAIDGNVLRIFARLRAIEKSIKDPDVKKEIKVEVERLLPNNRIGDFNQGLMEVGATICLPNGLPKCEICPIKKHCEAYRKGVTNKIPLKVAKKKNPSYKKTVLLVKYKDFYAIEKRPDKGLLRSMYQFPLFDEHLQEGDLAQYFTNNQISIQKLKNSKHKFSHLEWDMIGYLVTLEDKDPRYDFVETTEIVSKYSIPSAFKEYRNHIINDNVD